MKPTGLWYTTGLLSVLGLAQPSTAENAGFLELPLKRERNQPTTQGLVKRATGASLKRAWDNSTYTVNGNPSPYHASNPQSAAVR